MRARAVATQRAMLPDQAGSCDRNKSTANSARERRRPRIVFRHKHRDALVYDINGNGNPQWNSAAMEARSGTVLLWKPAVEQCCYGSRSGTVLQWKPAILPWKLVMRSIMRTCSYNHYVKTRALEIISQLPSVELFLLLIISAVHVV